MAKKETSDKVSSIASKVLATGKATPEEVKMLAASVLSQDEKPGGAPRAAPDKPPRPDDRA